MSKIDKNLCFLFVESDENSYKKLKTHLSRYLQNQEISNVEVLKISTDDDDENISIDDTCNILILLISAEMLSSSFIQSEVWQNFYFWHQDKTALVLPILVVPCDFMADEYLSKIPILPSNKKAILSSSWSSASEGYADAAKGIRLAIDKHFTEKTTFKSDTFNSFSNKFDFRSLFAKINIRPLFSSTDKIIRTVIIGLLCFILGKEMYHFGRKYMIIRALEANMIDVKGTPNFQTGNVDGNYNERFLHDVKIDDFSIGQHEVTTKEWLTVMEQDSVLNIGKDTCGDCPVRYVAYYDIEVFLKRLNGKTGKQYRLPTEQEWEYAARERGENNPPYNMTAENKEIGKFAWYHGNSDRKVHSDKRMPNKLNIYNMLGNVWEWCSGRYFYEDEKSVLNQQTNSGIIRGGSYQASSYNETPTPTIRQKIGLGELRENVGFRIALSK